MAVIDPQSFLGEFVPSVYISRILLESSGETLFIDNPHIDSSKENLSLLEQKNKTGKSLKVTINLVVKEKITDDNVATWFDKNDVIKYIDIKLFQSTDSRLTELLSSGIDMLDLVDPSKTVQPDDLRYIYAAYVYETDDIDLLNQKLYKNSTFKKLTLNKGKNLSNSIDEFKSYTDDAGNQIYDITYTVSFIIPNEFPEHLAYFAVSSFNLEELSKDYKLKIDSSNLEESIRKISSDIVIENGDIVSRSFVFYDRNGQIWSGPTVQSENGNWYTGIDITESSKPLVRSIVNNFKVQDNRSFKKLSINIESLYNKFLNNNPTKILSNNTVPVKKENYFSDLMLARGNDGDSKFLFAINIDKLICEKSIYGNLIKTSRKLREEILNNSTIRNLTIYRKRIKQDGQNYNIFDKNEPVEYIVNSRDSLPKTFVTVNNQRASLRESFILTSNERQYLRYFTGIDKTMSDVTTGLYQYHVELEIEDGTIDYVQTQIELLSLAKVELQKYYEISVTPGVSRTKLEIQEPHIQHPVETPASKKYQAPYYDPISNQFTQEFEKLMNQKYPTTNLLLAPWISATSVYVSVLDIFTDFLDNVVQRQKYLKDLHTAVSPSTGNPQGIMIVINLIDNLINALSKSIGITTTITPRKFGNSSQKSASFSRSARETIKIVKIFNEIFDSEIAKDFAYDYLSLGEDDTLNDDGVKIINGDDFNERMAAENLKNFNSSDDSINVSFAQNNVLIDDSVERTSFTFITPTRIDTPKKSYVLSTVSRKNPKPISIKPNIQKAIEPRIPYQPLTKPQLPLPIETIFKKSPVKPKRERVVENINEAPENKENKLSEIKSQIIFSTVMGRSNMVPKKDEEQNKKPISSKKDLSVKQEVKNTLQTNDNYSKILSTHSSAVFEKDFIRKRSPPRILKKSFPKDIKKPDVKAPIIKDKIEKNVIKNITKNNPTKLLDILVKPVAATKGFEKKEIKKAGPPNPNRNKIIKPSIINVKSTELKATKDAGNRIIIEGLRRPITEQKFKKLPNHVKKIFVKNEKAPPAPIPSVPSKPSEEFDYSLLNKIEYLESFEVNEFEDIILNEPIWKELTKAIYKSKIGKELLCRMKKYDDPDVGIEKIQALDKPMYDEVFILIPETIDETLFEIKPIKVESKKVTEQIIKSVTDAIPGVKFMEVVQPEPRVPSSRRQRGERPRPPIKEQIIVQQPIAAAIVQENILQIRKEPIVVAPIKTITIPEIKIKDPIKVTESDRPTNINLLPPIKVPGLDMPKIPSTITIIQDNNIGEQLTKKFELNDRSSIVNAITNLPQNTLININNVDINVPIKAASEMVALQSQVTLVNTSLMSNNQISNKKITDQIKTDLKTTTATISQANINITPVKLSDPVKPPVTAAAASVQTQKPPVISTTTSIAPSRPPQISTSSPIGKPPKKPITVQSAVKPTTTISSVNKVKK